MDQKTAVIQQTKEQFIAHGLKCAARAKEIRSGGANFFVAHQAGGGLALIFAKGGEKDGVKIGPHLRFGAVWAKNVANVSVAEVQKWNHDNPQHPVERIPLLAALANEALKTFELIQLLHDTEEKL
jgi:hypothetical protein